MPGRHPQLAPQEASKTDSAPDTLGASPEELVRDEIAAFEDHRTRLAKRRHEVLFELERLRTERAKAAAMGFPDIQRGTYDVAILMEQANLLIVREERRRVDQELADVRAFRVPRERPLYAQAKTLDRARTRLRCKLGLHVANSGRRRTPVFATRHTGCGGRPRARTRRTGARSASPSRAGPDVSDGEPPPAGRGASRRDDPRHLSEADQRARSERTRPRARASTYASPPDARRGTTGGDPVSRFGAPSPRA